MKKIVFLILFLTVLGKCQLLQAAESVPADRWMEIDLYWFDRDNMQGSVNEFLERYYPLIEDVNGWKGVIINVGWLTDYILEWQGDLKQQIMLPKNMKQWALFKENGMLTGTTEERMAIWKERFPEQRSYTTITYQPWTYGDLKKLVSLLKETARKKYKVQDFKVGSLVVAWDWIYNGDLSSFAKRHRNLHIQGVYVHGVIDLEAKLEADHNKFGAFPAGIPEGTPFTHFFGNQWGSLSRSIGLDAILLRDCFLGSGIYGRRGLAGLKAPEDPGKTDRWTKAACDLVKETKISNPDCIVIGYSNGASGVADLRVNSLDLEKIAREGYLDAWIDQTWAGAWNEVGQRPDTYWNSQELGWTYQLAYILTRAAVLADSKVRHYFLTETFDAWESWDIIHNAPERLRWGIWAYSHATVKTPSGLKTPKGSYISWCNQGKQLLSQADVKFIAENSNAAFIDASQMKNILGPTLVYNRSAMQWKSDNLPHIMIKEWIDEQSGSIMKWSIPVMSSTRLEYLPKVESDLFILQTPVHMTNKEKGVVVDLLRSGKPAAVFGSPAGGLDPEIAGLIGVSTKDKDSEKIKSTGSLNNMSGGIFENLQNTFHIYQPFSMNSFNNGLKVFYSVDGSPVLGLNSLQNRQILFWDPPELQINFSKPFHAPEPSLEEQLGSTTPWVLTSRLFNSLSKNNGMSYVEKIDPDNPVFIGMWQKSDGSYRVLSGNLEEGVTTRADQSRKLEFVFPASWTQKKICQIDEVWNESKQVTGNHRINIYLGQGESKLFTIRF